MSLDADTIDTFVFPTDQLNSKWFDLLANEMAIEDTID